MVSLLYSPEKTLTNSDLINCMKKIGKLLFLALVFIIGSSTVSNAQDYAATSYKIQTIFMYNFSKYIEWPADAAKGDFVIGVIGPDELVDEINKMATAKSTSERKFVVKQINNPSEVSNLHILLVASAENQHLAAAISKAEGSHTLVVSQSDGAITKGSCINFLVTSEGKLQYELNIEKIQSKGLKIASNLVAMAVRK